MEKHRARTSQEPRETPQEEFSFLPSNETDMSISDDPMPPAKKIRTSTSQEPRKTHQAESSLSPSNETDMSISDDPMPPAKKIRTSTRQEPRETRRDSSLLPSKETEIRIFGVFMTPGKKIQEPRVMSLSYDSPMNTDEEELKNTTDCLEKEEEERYGVSTELTLSVSETVPLIIKKELNENDIRGYLYLSEGVVESHILRYLSEDDQKNKLRQGDGMTVNVYDHDTHTTHEMLLVRSKTNQAQYRLKNSWLNDFVDRRGLKIGDEIGLFWDSKLHFRVVSRGIAD